MKAIFNLKMIVCVVFVQLNLNAQDVIRMHPNSNMYIHNTANMYIYGNFYNNSNLDSLRLVTANSKISFMGDTFQNFTNARTAGIGNITFLRPRPAPYAAAGSQILVAAGNAASFPTLYINNANGVNLYNADTKTRDSVRFLAGHFTLNGNNFTVGNSTTGVITGYDENKYFVTNDNQTATSGFLIRENVGATNTDFPVGIATNNYTPARLNNSGTADNYSVRVFPNVYEFATSGSNTEANELSVQRTWHIQEATNGGSDVALTLQHNTGSEGSKYSNTNNYVARYWGSAANTAYLDNSLYSYWDYANFSNSYANTAGTITTASNYGLMSSRANITSNFSGNTQYFTKAGFLAPLPIEILNLQAVWANKLNTIANVSWQTVSEINNHYFIIERSYDGSNWEMAGKVFSSAANGTSNTLLNYVFTDNNIKPINESTIVYYRLKQIDLNANFKIFGPLELNRNNTTGFDVNIYPNPAYKTIYISTPIIFSNIKDNIEIKIFDMVGKEVANFNTNAMQLANGFAIDAENFADGSYQIQVAKNEFVKTIKVLVVNN